MSDKTIKVRNDDIVLSRRILAILIDCFIITAPCILLGTIHIVFFELIYGLVIYKILKISVLLSLCFCYIAPIFKDVVNKRSFGKKIMKLSIESTDGSELSFKHLIIRNIFLYLWPIEFFILLLGLERLGDKAAKTKVVSL